LHVTVGYVEPLINSQVEANDAIGAFWLAMGATLQPDFNAQAFYGTSSEGTAQFTSSFGMCTQRRGRNATYTRPDTPEYTAFFYMVMALVTFFFVIASLRTNIVFVLVFIFIYLAFIMLMATYWTLAEGLTDVASKCQIVRALSPP